MKMFLEKTGVIRLGIIVMLGSLLFLICGCSPRSKVVQRVDTAMGTIVSQTLYQKEGTKKEGESILQEVIACIQNLEQEQLSRRLPGAEVYQINQAAGEKEGIRVSEELKMQLETCMEISEASEGAFDITIGKIVQLWDIDGWAEGAAADEFVIPSDAALEAALTDSGYEKVEIAPGTVKLPANVQMDMGAVGKGIALDRIRALLEQYKVEGAVISVGGSVLTYGAKPEGGSWNVGIVNPADTSQNIGVLKLSGGWCVSTSGDYERYVEKDGIRYHHIIDPSTGKPADSGVRSVTILTRNGLYSDALSTACFILGSERGMALAEQFGAEALFVLEDGSLAMTEGMQEYFCLSNAGK